MSTEEHQSACSPDSSRAPTFGDYARYGFSPLMAKYPIPAWCAFVGFELAFFYAGARLLHVPDHIGLLGMFAIFSAFSATVIWQSVRRHRNS